MITVGDRITALVRRMTGQGTMDKADNGEAGANENDNDIYYDNKWQPGGGQEEGQQWTPL